MPVCDNNNKKVNNNKKNNNKLTSWGAMKLCKNDPGRHEHDEEKDVSFQKHFLKKKCFIKLIIL